jgi:hypothetical protein
MIALRGVLLRSGMAFKALRRKSGAGDRLAGPVFSLTGDYPVRRISLGSQLRLAVYNKAWQKNR